MDWYSISSNGGVVLDCSGEEEAEMEGKLVDLPADLTFITGYELWVVTERIPLKVVSA